MGLFLESTGCGETTTNGLCACGKTVKIPLQSGKNVHYNGPNLAGTGVKTCATMNEALQQMDAIILDLRNQVLQLQLQIAQLT